MIKPNPTAARHSGDARAEDKIVDYCQKFESAPRGRKPATWHQQEFARVDELIASGMSKKVAITDVVNKRKNIPYVSAESFAIMYERWEQQRLLQKASDAIASGDERSGVDALTRLARRARRCGRRLSGKRGPKPKTELA